ncbi:hypothetical protein ACOSQ2_023904 [Xanthoceras sorbifolium]
MESPLNVPGWTPSPAREEDVLELQHIASTVVDKSTFPFSTAFHQPMKKEMEPVPHNNGVFLTWKDLHVKVSKGKNGSHLILQGLTGYAEPGEVLAIMGPSGSGKSSLLDAMAGRLSSNTQQSGDILINGLKVTCFWNFGKQK